MRTNFTDTAAELFLRKTLSDEQVAELMADDMLPEYDIDYSQVRPNRFAGREIASRTVEQDSDVIAAFKAEETVGNN